MKFGLRFSKNALVPSAKIMSVRDAAEGARFEFQAGGQIDILAAIDQHLRCLQSEAGQGGELGGELMASSKYLSLGATFITKPTASASWAVIGSPRRIISLALAAPIKRASLCVPPPPGKAPILISGKPKRARLRSDAKIAAKANSQPPPSA